MGPMYFFFFLNHILILYINIFCLTWRVILLNDSNSRSCVRTRFRIMGALSLNKKTFGKLHRLHLPYYVVWPHQSCRELLGILKVSGSSNWSNARNWVYRKWHSLSWAHSTLSRTWLGYWIHCGSQWFYILATVLDRSPMLLFNH